MKIAGFWKVFLIIILCNRKIYKQDFVGQGCKALLKNSKWCPKCGNSYGKYQQLSL